MGFKAAIGDAIVVSPNGDDANPGTLALPMRSIQLAADLAATRPGAHGKTVLLRDGVHYIQDTIYLTATHSGVAIRAYPGEAPTVSGGVKLDVVWKRYTATSGPCAAAGSACNLWKADVAGMVTEVPGLQIDGVRATRARYPNLPGGIEARHLRHHLHPTFLSLSPAPHHPARAVQHALRPARADRFGARKCDAACPGLSVSPSVHPSPRLQVSPMYDDMIQQNDGTWTPPDFAKFGDPTFFTDAVPSHDRNVTAQGWFEHYMIGINGLCSVYDPPVSYWCSQHPSGGGAFAFRTPTGVKVSQVRHNKNYIKNFDIMLGPLPTLY